jgi:hypothetical protein
VKAVGEKTWERTNNESYFGGGMKGVPANRHLQAQQYPCSAFEASLCLPWSSALKSRHLVKIRSFSRTLYYRRDLPSKLRNTWKLHPNIQGLTSQNLASYTVNRSNFRIFSTTSHNCEIRVCRNTRPERRGVLCLLRSLRLPSRTKSSSWSLPFRFLH